MAFNKPSYSDNISKLLLRIDESDDQVINRNFRDKMEPLLDAYDVLIQEDTEDMRAMKNFLDSSNAIMRREIVDFIKRKAKLARNDQKRIVTFFSELTKWYSDINNKRGNNNISDDSMYNYINFFKTFISLFSVVLPTMIINKQVQSIESPAYWGISQNHAMDLKRIVESYYEPLKKFYDNAIIKNVLYEIQGKCENTLLLSNETPALTKIQIGDAEIYSIFDKRMSTLLFEHYILLVFTEYINLTKDPTMLAKMLVVPESDKDNIYSSDFMVEQQLRFTETEQQYMEGDVVNLQENVASLLVAYVTMMMNSKDTIDMSYDTIMDRVFKLKETEKYTFTDRLKNLSEEERAVDTILKINKLGVWGKGLMKGIKEYDPENYDQEKVMTEKIAEIEKTVRRNANVTDRNADMFFEDALEEMDTDEQVNADEIMMGDINEDNDNGDPFGDERDADEDRDYN